ncbi:Zinc transporter ZIP8 [Orchesella cincta]|uniref:Zinc transporter ZIP8 n=1 Tax=Orchesella cincta TaxID=48709 RepID=A0A1D2N5N1_ORCCI|nr:Zinc transporter ZIP8 [Orchesella cincta]
MAMNISIAPPSLENDTFVNLRAGIVTPSLETWEVWASAFGFVTIINLSSIMGIIFFPLMKKSFYTIVMRTMIGLAIGSLSGSALFHLIPAAFRLDSIEKVEGGSHYVNIAFIVWLAAWIVMILECAIKIGVKMRAKSQSNKFSRTVAEAELVDVNDQEKKPLEIINSSLSLPHANGGLKVSDVQHNDGEPEVHSIHSSKSREQLGVYRSTLSLSRAMTDLQSEDAQPNQIKTVAWIVIIGDSLHNFIDGVSIGTSFVKSFHTGAIISMAIMCEEFPHELGDFAILINSGLSVKKALLFNFLSALTCYLGMALGIVLGEIEWDCYIFAFAAGIFLYVALGDMVPEVTSLIEEVSEISPRRAVNVLINHNFGILAGVGILYALALYQPV